ncbi:MAG: glycosyltransferase family 4 protein [Bacteroidales bacterium]
MQSNKYIIKNLAPWMLDELIAFSQITSFEIVFLRRQNDFYNEGISQLIENGIVIHNNPLSFKKICRKLYTSILFALNNLEKFRLNYNGVIGLKSILWFIKLDLNLFNSQSKIHAQFATQASIVSFLIKQFYHNTPEYSFTFHAYDIYFKNEWFNLLVENCKKAYSISNYNMEYVKKHYIVSDKIILSRLGVFPEAIPFVPTHKTDLNTFTLGLLSWFVEKKGIKYLLQAFIELKNQAYSNIHLILAGDGPLKEEYLAFIEKNQLSDSIKYIGIIKGEEKRKFFQSLDAFILPSVAIENDMDGIPVVLMEAVNYGLPIISTNISGIPEICINDYNGLLINERDIDQIKKALTRLLNPVLRQKYSINSLKMASQYNIVSNSKHKLSMLNWT